MKKYIFFTNPLHEIGGTQMVVAGKANYLEKHGWEVYAFTRGKSYGKSQIPSLTNMSLVVVLMSYINFLINYRTKNEASFLKKWLIF